jgi:LmbE family N-acetylglucosaminyl deacetylase
MTLTHSGNGARFAARPLTVDGTPTQEWLDALANAPELDMTACREILVVAAHPDDETLGFGAALATLAGLGARVQVVAVSDGGASHPGRDRGGLESIRRAELHDAMRVLGLPAPICLGMPDGELNDYEDLLADRLTAMLADRPGTPWIAATWRGDGHPDHEAVGRAAAAAAQRRGAVLVEYPIWMWHWATPGDVAVPWDRLRVVPAASHALERKAAAAQCYRSQIQMASQWGSVEPAPLPSFVGRRLLAVREVVF